MAASLTSSTMTTAEKYIWRKKWSRVGKRNRQTGIATYRLYRPTRQCSENAWTMPFRTNIQYLAEKLNLGGILNLAISGCQTKPNRQMTGCTASAITRTNCPSITLHITTIHTTTLHCISPQYIPSRYTVYHHNTYHHAKMHITTIHTTTLHCISPQYIPLR